MTITRRTVLCVDDDPDDQVMVLETIKEIDPTFKVASALNGEEALRFLEYAKTRGELPCLVILDINMPVMDGKETLMHIKKDDALDAIPVVLFTTSANPLDKSFAEKHGAQFVTKPCNYKNYHETVERLLSFCRQ